MSDKLGSALAELSAEARDVDLRERVLAGSRRRRTRRRIRHGTAAVVAVCLLALGGFVGLDLDRTTPAADQLGTMYFQSESDGDTRLLRRDGDGTIEAVLTLDSSRVAGLAVSPSGDFASWQQFDPATDEQRAEYVLPPADVPSEVWIMDLRTGEESMLYEYSADDWLCQPPTWAPDGEPQLLVHNPYSGGGGMMWRDVTSAVETISYDVGANGMDSPRDDCGVLPAVDSNGRYRLFGLEFDTEARREMLWILDAKRDRREKPLEAAMVGAELSALNVTGDLLCLSDKKSASPSWSRAKPCDYIVDSDTGRVTESQRDGDWQQLIWLADGRQVWRSTDGMVRIEDPGGREFEPLVLEPELVEADLLVVGA